MTVLILNGPNLNLLGRREPDVYGSTTLEQIEQSCQQTAGQLGLTITFQQSNHEGQLIDWVQTAAEQGHTHIILNAAGYTHTSVALRDAVAACSLPVIEVHLSNIHAREEFRQTSLLSPVAAGIICGFGAIVYNLALHAVAGQK